MTAPTIISDGSPATGNDETSTYHNGPISRLNAWFFDTFDRYINFVSRPARS